MTPEIDLRGLRKTSPSEYLLRFAFGGIVTTCTGIIAHEYGPSIGGLFLGFPAILPASLTLVRRHDGRRQAVEDARGAVLGAVGLMVFAAVTALLATRVRTAVVLAAATCAWGLIAIACWTVIHRRR